MGIFDAFKRNRADADAKGKSTPSGIADLLRTAQNAPSVDIYEKELPKFNVVDDDLINRIAPAHVILYPDKVNIGGVYATFYYISEWSSGLSRPMWRELLQFKGTVHVSYHCEVIPPGQAALMLRKEFGALLAQQFFRARTKKVTDVVDTVRGQMVSSARIATEIGGEPIIFISVVIGVMAPTEEALADSCKALEVHLKNMGVRAYKAVYQQKEGLISILPLGMNMLNDHRRNINPLTLAQMFPNLSEEIVYPRGLLFGRDMTSGAAVVIDQYELTNPNIIIIGKPGSGKSFTMKSLLEQAIIQGIQCYVMDIEGEYVKLCEDLGGIYLDMSLKSPIKINILDFDPDDPEGYVGGQEDFREWLQMVIGHKMLDAEKVVFERAYDMVFNRRGIFRDKPETYRYAPPTLSDLYEVLFEMAETEKDPAHRKASASLRDALYRFSVGSLSEAFNCQSNMQIRYNPLVVFGLKDAGTDEIKILRTKQIQTWVWNKMLNTMSRKMEVLDESWFFLKHQVVAQAIEERARRMRKKNASLILGTQNITDFSDNPWALAVLRVAQTYMLFGNTPAGIDVVAQTLQLSLPEKQLLSTLTPGEFLLISGSIRRPVKHIVPESRYMTYTTKPSDVGL